MGYKKIIVKGISWMAILRVVIRSLTLVKIVILARLLTPSQFGYYGIALLILGFIELATDTGVNVILIQEKGSIEKYIDTSWIISILRGVLMFVVIYLTAPIVSNFFAAAQVTNLIRLASIIPLIKGFINPSVVRFQKDLHFGKEFWYRSSLYLADALVAITLGVITHSEYSLVWAMVIGAILEVILSMAVVKPIPSLRFNTSLAKDIVKEGKWVTLSGIFEYLFQNIDDIAVGRILGATPLGLYQQAYRVSTLTTSEAGEIFNKVTFPVYTKISDDKKILRDAFLKVSLVIGVLVIPFGLILVFWASDVTRILLGNQWLPMVPALQVLAIFGILKALSNSAYSLLLALKKQQAVTFITLIGISGMAVTLIPLIRAFGIVGAGYSAIVGVLLGLPLVLYYLSKSLRP